MDNRSSIAVNLEQTAIPRLAISAEERRQTLETAEIGLLLLELLWRRRLLAILAKTSTAFETAISECLHFHSLAATENGGASMHRGKRE